MGGLHVVTRVSAGPTAGTYYPHTDHLGSLNVLTNSSGQVVQRLTYRPYDETFSNTGSVDFEQHRYTGQEQDPETGLYFYQARYYNPVLGRFLSPDSIIPNAGNPQSLNRFSYVLNNPVNLVDPSGHSWLSKFFNRVVKPWLWIEVPVGKIIADVVCAYYCPYAIPLINATADAVNAWAHGASGRQIYQAAARGFASGAVIATAGVLGAALGCNGG